MNITSTGPKQWLINDSADISTAVILRALAVGYRHIINQITLSAAGAGVITIGEGLDNGTIQKIFLEIDVNATSSFPLVLKRQIKLTNGKALIIESSTSAVTTFVVEGETETV